MTFVRDTRNMNYGKWIEYFVYISRYHSHEIIRIRYTLLHEKCIVSLLMKLLALTYKIINISILYHQTKFPQISRRRSRHILTEAR